MGPPGLQSRPGRSKSQMNSQDSHYFIKYHYERIKHHTTLTIKGTKKINSTVT
ncbi:hypothetical protein [Holzapfeliella floricola]|uniref:Uncharacterized protein n=1 Tax=Holzapfeliella floricola DSM 23037 = JCM 16512 TaxID=1423744 RepID=A0A0R2DL22_9LACO|nr:hypothetical protein [Holzapfeliella floricola]KRN04831.1 hypothetical protein FC86_GL001189 [Holzapfeliella floricola DSM 23037 = JCM 16512]